jgi:hypothetical protein
MHKQWVQDQDISGYQLNLSLGGQLLLTTGERVGGGLEAQAISQALMLSQHIQDTTDGRVLSPYRQHDWAIDEIDDGNVYGDQLWRAFGNRCGLAAPGHPAVKRIGNDDVSGADHDCGFGRFHIEKCMDTGTTVTHDTDIA